ncbi:MAG: ammonium transporter, partial [Asticcacaulis sp.]|nr:ammonium transporter [Asticcacaulis sp.]
MSVATAVTTTTGSAAPHLLAHQATLALNSGDTAWMIVATALVLFMTLPGVALFYGGMVRKKNLLSTLAQSVAVTVVASIIWILIGYSLSFGVAAGKANDFIGGFDAALLHGVRLDTAY